MSIHKFCCANHKLFVEIISRGVKEIKCHFQAFCKLAIPLFYKDLPKIICMTKNLNDLVCYIYTTKTNSCQHLKSVSGRYIFIERSEGQMATVWIILLMLKPISKSRTFYYVTTESFPIGLYHLISHRENLNTDLLLRYSVNLTFSETVCVYLFLFAKTLDYLIVQDILMLINDNIVCGNEIGYGKKKKIY